MNQKVNVYVDASKGVGVQEHLWRYIGYDECNYTYIPEGKELLKKFASLGDAPYYVRTHFMFCTGNCHGTYKFGSTNIYWENENGEAVYDFTYYDKIMDAILQTGNKPFAELGFMPLELVDQSYLKSSEGRWERYGAYKEKGWTCPPKNYEKWADFIRTLITHLVERYGEDEIQTWYFELWNEPDIFYWSGTTAEYCKLFDYTEYAAHQVLPGLRLSGPATTGITPESHSGKFFTYFLEHCKNGVNFCTQKTGTRLDFITFHVKGGGFPFEMHAPKEVPSVESLVDQVRRGLDIIQECGYADREVVLSEADPDGWAAGGMYDNINMNFRNTEYYASYVASTYQKIDQLSVQYGIKVRPLAWAFLFPGERCFEGTRTFTTQGIDKAVFNLFKIYGSLGHEKLAFSSDGVHDPEFQQPYRKVDVHTGCYTGEGETTEVAGMAIKGDNGEIQILVFSHNNDCDKKETHKVCVTVSGLDERTRVLEHYRIDETHSNAYAEWIHQGKPLFPQGEQYALIKKRDGLEKYEEDRTVTAKDGNVQIEFSMPAHGVSYLVLR